MPAMFRDAFEPWPRLAPIRALRFSSLRLPKPLVDESADSVQAEGPEDRIHVLSGFLLIGSPIAGAPAAALPRRPYCVSFHAACLLPFAVTIVTRPRLTS